MPKIKGFYKLYDKKLLPFLDKKIKLLEIGVQDGSSIKYWRSLSPKWDVWGLDTDSRCAGNQIVIGSQEDKEVLKQFEGFDIVIDDGGHTMKQQIETFKQLFPTMRSGSLYVIEDLHTSFWREFQDYNQTTVDFLHEITKTIHREEANNPSRLAGNPLLDNYDIASVEYYPSIVFIYKQ